ncbi:hypothetical protein AKJ16_DCAP12239 [Drosera capensis]
MEIWSGGVLLIELSEGRLNSLTKLLSLELAEGKEIEGYQRNLGTKSCCLESYISTGSHSSNQRFAPDKGTLFPDRHLPLENDSVSKRKAYIHVCILGKRQSKAPALLEICFTALQVPAVTNNILICSWCSYNITRSMIPGRMLDETRYSTGTASLIRIDS